MIVGIDNDKLEFIATDDGQLVVTLRNLTEAIADREEFLNACVTHCKDCKHFTRDSITGVTIPGTEYCIFTMNNRIEENDYCSRAERRTDEIN